MSIKYGKENPGYFISAALADITDNVEAVLFAAPGSNYTNYLCNLIVTNNDADTGTVVKILDGSGGAAKFRAYAAEDGGGFVAAFDPPLKFTAETAVYVQCETTGATVQVSASGFKA